MPRPVRRESIYQRDACQIEIYDGYCRACFMPSMPDAESNSC